MHDATDSSGAGGDDARPLRTPADGVSSARASRHGRQILHRRTSRRPRDARSPWTRLAAVVASFALVAVTMVTGAATATGTPEEPVDITVDGAHVAAAALNRNGLTFKGFGVLTANSTSALLMDYKAQHPRKYWELIETLFGGGNPIMNTVKIEMGNDRNTSTGPNAATMRSRGEFPNVQREPGFQLAADAQTVAEGDVHLSLLRWSRPTWVTSHADQYVWFKNTTLAAYREYGIMVDSINPDTNETHDPDVQLYKDFSAWVRGDDNGYEGATPDDPNNGFESEEEKALFRGIQTVAGDTVGTPPAGFGNAMTASGDSSLRDAVDIVGFHYSSADDSAGNYKRIAEELDLEVWNSEGQATFSSSADRPHNTNDNGRGGTGTEFGGTLGALEMGNWITAGFANSRRTHTIYQPAIGSFYEGFQYSSKELVNARDPWSGWIYYDGGLAVLQHFTQFATLGWENDDNTAGIWRAIPQASRSTVGTGNPPSGATEGRESFTTLAAPDASDFSTVIVNDSSFTKTYRITTRDLNLGSDATMELWETRAADLGQAYDENYLKPFDEITPDANGTYTVTVKPWSVVTATTVDRATTVGGVLVPRDTYGNAVPTSPEYTHDDGGRDVLDTDATGMVNGVTDDGVLYADDFDYREYGNVQAYDPVSGELLDSGVSFLDSRGARAKPAATPNVDSADSGATPRYTNDTNGAFESVATPDPDRGRVLRQQIGPGMVGGAWNGGDPITTIGDHRWANYKVSVDVLFEDGSGRYATLGARQQGGTSNGQNAAAAQLRIDPVGAWSLQRYGTTVASGNVSDTPGTDFAAGSGQWNTLSLQVAGDVYTAYVNGVEIVSYTDLAPQAAGRVQLGSAFTFTQFDNLVVETVEGYTPYYAAVIDGMHQASWEDTSDPVLEFDDSWTHVNGQGMYEWQRTASRSTGQGASVSYTFTGTGLDIIGSNNGTATLDVIVDGVRTVEGAATFSAGSARTTFTLRGLENGEHTVTFETASSASINIDAIGVVRANARSAEVDTAALERAVADTAQLEEDEYNPATWEPFAELFTQAERAVADPVSYGLDVEGAAALAAHLVAAAGRLVPQDVSEDVTDMGVVAVVAEGELPAILTFDGTEAEVIWDGGAAEQVAATVVLDTVTLTGRTSEKLDAGVYQRFRATVLVVPNDLMYFVDSGSAGSERGSAHAGVRSAVPGLLNESADQQWDGTTAGLTWGYSTQADIVAAGNAQDWGSSYVGANYGQPITYRLTLPAGTYEIGTFHAPRPGSTTNFYTTVRSDDHENRVDATSTGSATPVVQQLTVDEKTVVDVEFGTNGTSGFNARLALVYVQAVTRDLGVQGALTAIEPLPSTVTIGGVETTVTWDEESVSQERSEYQTLHLTGVVGEGQPVVARYEVVPDGLVYYIDSGTDGAESPEFVAVRDAVPGLRNDQVDRVSPSPDQWGYVATGMQVKADTHIEDKYSTGFYQDTTELIYRLPLEAGTYTLTAGFTEWWDAVRTMNQTVLVDGTELARSNVPLSGTNTPLTSDVTFTLDEAATVTYFLTNEGAGSEKPVISWLAVAARSDTQDLPDVSVEPTTRCVAGNVVLAVQVENGEDGPVDVSVVTPYGSRSFAGLAAGGSGSAAFATRATVIAAGELEVSVSVPGIDGEFSSTVPFAAASCGSP